MKKLRILFALVGFVFTLNVLSNCFAGGPNPVVESFKKSLVAVAHEDLIFWAPIFEEMSTVVAGGSMSQQDIFDVISDVLGWSPLYWYVLFMNSNAFEDHIQKADELAIDVNTQDKKGMTVLQFTLMLLQHSSGEERRIVAQQFRPFIKLLVEKNAFLRVPQDTNVIRHFYARDEALHKLIWGNWVG